MPRVNVYGFFLTMTKKMRGRQTVAWIARLRDKIHRVIEPQRELHCITKILQEEI